MERQTLEVYFVEWLRHNLRREVRGMVDPLIEPGGMDIVGYDVDDERARTRYVIMTSADILASMALCVSGREPNWDRLYEEFRNATLPAIRYYRKNR